MILITGATGNVGSAAVAELTRLGLPARALTRDPSRAQFPPHTQVVTGSTSDRAAMEEALADVDAVFLNIVGDPRPCIEALGVIQPQRVVLLSSLTAGTRPNLAYAAHFAELEQAIRDVAPEACILRPGQFASNVAWWTPMLDSGVVQAPFLDVGLPTIAPEDIGAVAAQALTTDHYAGQTLVLSGPALVTPRQQIAAIAKASDRTLTAVEIPEDEFASRSGFDDAEAAEYLIQVMGHPRPEELQISPAVATVTGRQPLTFETWAIQNHTLFT